MNKLANLVVPPELLKKKVKEKVIQPELQLYIEEAPIDYTPKKEEKEGPAIIIIDYGEE